MHQQNIYYKQLAQISSMLLQTANTSHQKYRKTSAWWSQTRTLPTHSPLQRSISQSLQISQHSTEIIAKKSRKKSLGFCLIKRTDHPHRGKDQIHSSENAQTQRIKHLLLRAHQRRRQSVGWCLKIYVLYPQKRWYGKKTIRISHRTNYLWTTAQVIRKKLQF